MCVFEDLFEGAGFTFLVLDAVGVEEMVPSGVYDVAEFGVFDREYSEVCASVAADVVGLVVLGGGFYPNFCFCHVLGLSSGWSWNIQSVIDVLRGFSIAGFSCSSSPLGGWMRIRAIGVNPMMRIGGMMAARNQRVMGLPPRIAVVLR